MPIRNEINVRLEGLNTALEQIYGLQLSKAVDEALLVAYNSFTAWVNEPLLDALAASDTDFISLLAKGNFATNELDKLAELLHAMCQLFAIKLDASRLEVAQHKLALLIHFVNERDRTYSLQRNNWLDATEQNID